MQKIFLRTYWFLDIILIATTGGISSTIPTHAMQHEDVEKVIKRLAKIQQKYEEHDPFPLVHESLHDAKNLGLREDTGCKNCKEIGLREGEGWQDYAAPPTDIDWNQDDVCQKRDRDSELRMRLNELMQEPVAVQLIATAWCQAAFKHQNAPARWCTERKNIISSCLALWYKKPQESHTLSWLCERVIVLSVCEWKKENISEGKKRSAAKTNTISEPKRLKQTTLYDFSADPV